MPYRLLLVLTCLSLLLGGCSTGYAPVSERSLGARSSSKGPAPARYRVQRGDTLYSIAFRYGLDYRRVARWNNIDSRYFIYPGQKLRLKPPVAASSQSRPTSRSNSPATAPATSTSSRTVAAAGSTGSAATTRPAKPAKPAKPSAATTGKTSTATAPVRWHWPHSGKIILAFGRGQPANKGLDIAGRSGETVKAAAHGEVVYAGNGLLGYGNLVIINHDKRYLSAYAHNSRIFVREGDKVKAGEKIAEIGKTGATRSMLHFEIRRDGDPVDPLRYLPKR
ncbi:peptidoglycan DD-metalloendopeptidase family protein [Marinobacterium maritimum]|uniref:Peptidoglycan DD-metalloendopeptidase family protein n=1 Tax=Marinobacterium maritimum TaxID=500162 RepID=A0ABN1I7X9_9GAMM